MDYRKVISDIQSHMNKNKAPGDDLTSILSAVTGKHSGSVYRKESEKRRLKSETNKQIY